MNNINIDEWLKYCSLYKKNQEGLGFKMKLTLNQGKLEISFSNLEERYIDVIKNLVISISQETVKYLYNLFDPTYISDREDYEAFCETSYNIMKENTLDFLETLFQNGIDAFYALVFQHVHVLRAKYALDHVRYENKKWVNSKGELWNGTNWEKDGSPIGYPLDQMWRDLLSA